jgi:hypothetical protein
MPKSKTLARHQQNTDIRVSKVYYGGKGDLENPCAAFAGRKNILMHFGFFAGANGVHGHAWGPHAVLGSVFVIPQDDQLFSNLERLDFSNVYCHLQIFRGMERNMTLQGKTSEAENSVRELKSLLIASYSALFPCAIAGSTRLCSQFPSIDCPASG